MQFKLKKFNIFLVILSNLYIVYWPRKYINYLLGITKTSIISSLKIYFNSNDYNLFSIME